MPTNLSVARGLNRLDLGIACANTRKSVNKPAKVIPELA
jgi:hypothetical protein